MSVSTLTPLLYVRDVETSLKFYEGLLGFKAGQTFDEGGPVLWCELTSGEARLMLNRDVERNHAARLPDDFGAVLYMGVPSVHDLMTRLRGAGFEASDPEAQVYGVDQIWARDPDGYALCFTSPKI